MADNRKEQERDELHRTIWGIANDLRGSVDGWDFKQYVLGMLFYRYISENFANYINDGEREAGDATFDYAQLSDSDAEQARDDLIKTKGFFILPSQLFCSVRSRAPLDENLNETLEAVFQAIEDSAKGSDSEDDFKGLFDDMDEGESGWSPYQKTLDRQLFQAPRTPESEPRKSRSAKRAEEPEAPRLDQCSLL